MKNIVFSTNSGFFASTLVDNLGDDFKVSVISPDDLYFSIDQGTLNGTDLLALAGNVTFGEKTITKVKGTGIKNILDGTIVVDHDRLSKLMSFREGCTLAQYTKVPLSETYLIYTIAKLFKKYEIQEMFTTMMLSASHYGDEGVEEITSQTVSIFNQEEIVARLFRERLAFNIIPLISKKNSSGYLTGIEKELEVMMRKRILKKFLFNMQVVLAPTLSSTGVVFTLKLKEKIDLLALQGLFEKNTLLFQTYGHEALAPVNSAINDGKIHVTSFHVIDEHTVSFYAVADNVWTLFINNFVRCIETIA